MRGLRGRLKAPFLAVALLFLPSPAAADEMVQVTSGYLDWSGENPISGTFAFSSDRFSIPGVVMFGFPPTLTLNDLEPGATVFSRGGWVSQDVVRRNPVVVDGVPYDPIHFLDFANITFDSGHFVLPTTGADLITIQAPFAFVPGSRLYLFETTSQHAQPSDALFRFGLLGGGVVTTTFRRMDVVNRYFHVRSLFEFSSNPPAPTPEPASMLLLGTAVAGIAVARRRRRLQAIRSKALGK
jgi:hypothetical protein